MPPINIFFSNCHPSPEIHIHPKMSSTKAKLDAMLAKEAREKCEQEEKEWEQEELKRALERQVEAEQQAEAKAEAKRAAKAEKKQLKDIQDWDQKVREE